MNRRKVHNLASTWFGLASGTHLRRRAGSLCGNAHWAYTDLGTSGSAETWARTFTGFGARHVLAHISSDSQRQMIVCRAASPLLNRVHTRSIARASTHSRCLNCADDITCSAHVRSGPSSQTFSGVTKPILSLRLRISPGSIPRVEFRSTIFRLDPSIF